MSDTRPEAARPLGGRSIIVTRTREQSGTLSASLETLGAKVIEIPTIAIVPPESYEALDGALGRLGSYDWLLVTSANAARAISARLAAPPPSTLKVAAVGRATADALATAGFRVSLVPQPYVAESLIAALSGQVSGKRVLLARAAVARDVLPEALRAEGALVDIAEAYRTVLPEASQVLLADVLTAGPVPDGVTFTSSSTVTHFLALVHSAGLALPDSLRAFSIGPVTSATLREQGWPPAAEAAEHDVRGLVAAVVAYLAGRP